MLIWMADGYLHEARMLGQQPDMDVMMAEFTKWMEMFRKFVYKGGISGMNIIDIQDITKDYGGGRGVFDIAFQVKRGEVLGFLGLTDAGKTTTIRQAMGFLKKPDKGKVLILGKDCFKGRTRSRAFGYLPGEIAFIDSMTGMEFIRFIARMKGMKEQPRPSGDGAVRTGSFSQDQENVKGTKQKNRYRMRFYAGS